MESIFESLENLPVSEECFNDIMDIIEGIIDESKKSIGDTIVNSYSTKAAAENPENPTETEAYKRGKELINKWNAIPKSKQPEEYYGQGDELQKSWSPDEGTLKTKSIHKGEAISDINKPKDESDFNRRRNFVEKYKSKIRKNGTKVQTEDRFGNPRTVYKYGNRTIDFDNLPLP